MSFALAFCVASAIARSVPQSAGRASGRSGRCCGRRCNEQSTVFHSRELSGPGRRQRSKGQTDRGPVRSPCGGRKCVATKLGLAASAGRHPPRSPPRAGQAGDRPLPAVSAFSNDDRSLLARLLHSLEPSAARQRDFRPEQKQWKQNALAAGMYAFREKEPLWRTSVRRSPSLISVEDGVAAAGSMPYR
jgi:hypothetical protein